MEQVVAWLTIYGFRVLGAIIILIAGIWAAKLLTRILRRVLENRKVDQTLVTFGGNLLHTALIAFVAIAALNQVGVQTTSFIAVLGAAGLAVGLALQGSLSNFAAGVMILIFRPFDVGDVIEGAGVIGVVEDIHIVNTQLKTGDNKTVYIPNGKLVNDNLTNYSKKGTRRMDLTIGVSYSDQIPRVKEILMNILENDERILRDPAPMVGVLELADSSVNFAVRPWVSVGDYWNVHFDLMERIKMRLDEEGVSIPFPQRDIHVFQTEPTKAA